MKKLKREKASLWGQVETITPMLIDEIFGDGSEWIWFQYMDDRPSYYVARVPTGTHQQIKDRSDRFYDDLLPLIESAIESEAMDFYGPRQWKEYEKGEGISNSRRWPIPPYFPSGSAWGRYTPDKETLHRAGLFVNSKTSEEVRG